MSWFSTAIILLCGATGFAVVQQILATEVEGWILVLSRRVVRRAALRIPDPHRLRYEEEWLAEIATIGSRPISALTYSLWVLMHARRTGREIRAGDRERAAAPAESASCVTVGDVWEALIALDVRPEGVGLGSAYFRLPDGRLLKFPNQQFFDHGIASDELLAVFASLGVQPSASGKYPMPPDANDYMRRPRDPMFV